MLPRQQLRLCTTNFLLSMVRQFESTKKTEYVDYVIDKVYWFRDVLFKMRGGRSRAV